MAYLLFAGEGYYPQGGGYDLIGRFDTVEAAKAAFNPDAPEYNRGNDSFAHVLCLDTLRVIVRHYKGQWVAE